MVCNRYRSKCRAGVLASLRQGTRRPPAGGSGWAIGLRVSVAARLLGPASQPRTDGIALASRFTGRTEPAHQETAPRSSIAATARQHSVAKVVARCGSTHPLFSKEATNKGRTSRAVFRAGIRRLAIIRSRAALEALASRPATTAAVVVDEASVAAQVVAMPDHAQAAADLPVVVADIPLAAEEAVTTARSLPITGIM